MVKITEYKLYSYRFVIAIIYGMDICYIAMMFPAFNPISVKLEAIYQHSSVIISLGNFDLF